MALDKQRILHELSSVMNQLQRADCGCMGKLISNPEEGALMSGNCMPTAPGNSGCGHRRGCCRGMGFNSTPQASFNAPCAGELSQTNTTMNHCLGHCNPTKLYADTYKYLNGNLMQPVVKEVYDDLSSLTPANTVMNTPVSNRIGTNAPPTLLEDTKGMVGNQIMGNITNNPMIPNQITGNTVNNPMMPQQAMRNTAYNSMMPHQVAGNTTNNSIIPNQVTGNNAMMSNQVPERFTGVGPQIVNMFMKEDSLNQKNILKQGSPLTDHKTVNDPRSPQAPASNTPLTEPPGNQYGSNMNQINERKPIQNYLPYSMPIQQNSQYSNNNSTPDALQVTGKSNYGQHTQGINKFNEIFPGVMQGLGGDLGFDPIAIAVQMNPANQQKAAMDTIQKLMYGNSGHDRSAINGNAAPMSASVANPEQNEHAQNDSSLTNEQTNLQTPPFQQNLSVQGEAQPIQEQVYATHTSAPIINQHNSEPQNLSQYQTTPQVQAIIPPLQTQQQIVNPNIEVVDPNNLSTEKTQDLHTGQVKKEQIFPVDTSTCHRVPIMKTQKQYEFNTLGQPVEMLPAKLYRPLEPPLPQTLSPQDTPTVAASQRYSNVKSTISKTSILGNKRDSRSQLKHVYNQYKGSSSSAPQNLRIPGGVSHSEGKLARQPEVTHPVPIESVGGDTQVNNQFKNDMITSKINEVNDDKGDLRSVNKPYGDIIPDKVIPTGKQSRNGIQDMTYPSYSMSSAWSFQRPLRSLHNEICRY